MSTTAEPLPELAADRLQPMLSARYALGLRHLLLTAAVGLLFVHLNAIPLFHSDIWGHVHYGRWMLDHGTLVHDDPFMPLAAGMRNIVTPWLSQIVLALAESRGGGEALSTLFALAGAATYLLLCRAFYRQSGRLAVAVLGAGLALGFGWFRHAIIRPEMFGGLCLAVLLWLIADAATNDVFSGSTDNEPQPANKAANWLTAHRRWIALYLGIPLLFVVWANLHGSFAVGLGVLACIFLGHVVEAAWRTRTFPGVVNDWTCRHWLFLTQLALAACLINPYGMELLVETVQFSKNPNLRDVQEWFPMNLISSQGGLLLASWVLVCVVFRHSRRRVRPHEILLLALFSAAVVPSERMMGWYAPVVVFGLLPHLAEIAGRLWPVAQAPAETAPLDSMSFKYTLACGMVLWIAFALSPSAAMVLRVKPRPNGNLYSPQTPVALTKHLREQPSRGIVFAPQWWGDWLAWDGPESLKPFVTTHIHLAPQRVWRDYMLIVQGQPGWERALDRYGVRDLVIHKELQRPFLTLVRKSPEWKVAYEDDLAVHLTRTTIPTAPAAGNAHDKQSEAPPAEAAKD